jgi:hypothetical protein
MLLAAPHARKKQNSGEKSAKAASGRNVARKSMTRTAINTMPVPRYWNKMIN